MLTFSIFKSSPETVLVCVGTLPRLRPDWTHPPIQCQLQMASVALYIVTFRERPLVCGSSNPLHCVHPTCCPLRYIGWYKHTVKCQTCPINGTINNTFSHLKTFCSFSWQMKNAERWGEKRTGMSERKHYSDQVDTDGRRQKKCADTLLAQSSLTRRVVVVAIFAVAARTVIK